MGCAMVTGDYAIPWACRGGKRQLCWAEAQPPCAFRKICRCHGFGCLYKLQQSVSSGSLAVGGTSVSLCGFLDLYQDLSDILSQTVTVPSSASRSGHTKAGSLACPVAGQSPSVMAEEGEVGDCHPTRCHKEAMQPGSCMLEPSSVRGHVVRQ